MVKNYKKGKIYRIYCLVGEEGDEYIGSSCRDYLCQRWGQHRSGYKSWKQGKTHKCNSYDLFDKYGLDNCIVELLEEYPCDNVEQLRLKEGEYIKQRMCVNKSVAGQLPAEYQKIYMEQDGNKERKYELQKIRRANQSEEEKERIRLRHNELQKIRRNNVVVD